MIKLIKATTVLMIIGSVFVAATWNTNFRYSIRNWAIQAFMEDLYLYNGADILSDSLSSASTDPDIPVPLNMTDYISFEDDFIALSIGPMSAATNGPITPIAGKDSAYALTTWLYGIDAYDSVVTYPPIPVDTTGGVIALRIGRADNDSVKLITASEFVKVDTIGGLKAWYYCRLYVPDTTQFEFRVGLFEKNMAVTGATVSGIYFQNVDESNKVTFVTNRAGSIDSVTAIANISSDTWYELAFYLDGLGTVTGYVNRVALTTISKYVPRTANLAVGFIFKNGAAYAAAARRQIGIDKVSYIQERH